MELSWIWSFKKYRYWTDFGHFLKLIIGNTQKSTSESSRKTECRASQNITWQQTIWPLKFPPEIYKKNLKRDPSTRHHSSPYCSSHFLFWKKTQLFSSSHWLSSQNPAFFPFLVTHLWQPNMLDEHANSNQKWYVFKREKKYLELSMPSSEFTWIVQDSDRHRKITIHFLSWMFFPSFEHYFLFVSFPYLARKFF